MSLSKQVHIRILEQTTGHPDIDQPQIRLEEGLTTMIDWIRTRGTRPFVHNIELEIGSNLAPRTCTEKLL